MASHNKNKTRYTMRVLETFNLKSWDGSLKIEEKECVLTALEQGKVIFLPYLPFPIDKNEMLFLSGIRCKRRVKNISYDCESGRLNGSDIKGHEEEKLRSLLLRYSVTTRKLAEEVLHVYCPNLKQAFTSFRPLEVATRVSSFRKDDQRLHTDAFPSRPTQGSRILRIFSNVNPEGWPRIWRIGETFEDFVPKFLPKTSKQILGMNRVMRALKITKTLRSRYDHIMLQLHDLVKLDMQYQKESPQVQVAFPAGSTWIVYTDQVLHAAMAGQFLFEQTFHLPVDAQRWPELSPLRVLERLTGQTLT